jgi:hypothetical protein
LSSNESDHEAYDDFCIPSGDITVMRRLAKKTNVLPIIARADCLTNDVLDAIKRVIRRDIENAGLDLGVFGSIGGRDAPNPQRTIAHVNGHGNAHGPARRAGGDSDPSPKEHSDEDEDDSEPEEERRSRPVIKLNRFKLPWNRSRSRTRIEETEPADEPTSLDAMDSESVASVRFSAHALAKTSVADMLPFAVISPEHFGTRRRAQAVSQTAAPPERQSVHADAGVASSDDMHGAGSSAASSPVSTSRHAPLLAGPPEDLRGVFVRRFRWGTIDVLSPEHCDFAALRTTVLSTHMKVCRVMSSDMNMFDSRARVDAQDTHERGPVRALSYREAARSSCDTEYQRGSNSQDVPRCVWLLSVPCSYMYLIFEIQN